MPNLVRRGPFEEQHTRPKCRRKLHDYFTAGVQLVWYIDPRKRTARASTAEDQFVEFDEKGSLSGGEVSAGFELSLAERIQLAENPAGLRHWHTALPHTKDGRKENEGKENDESLHSSSFPPSSFPPHSNSASRRLTTRIPAGAGRAGS